MDCNQLTEEGVGRGFPLQGRSAVLEQLWSCHGKRFDDRRVAGRRAHPIPVFLGQSGIGKYVLLRTTVMPACLLACLP
jgi:hypothetical protein